MNVIIIAAGYAKRLGNLTKSTPKGLLKVNRKTILDRQIELFKKKNLSDILIIRGPHKNFDIKDVLYVDDIDYQNHDVLGSLMSAKKYLVGRVLTSYSDILFEEKVLDQLLKFEGDIGIPIDLDWEKNYERRTLHPKSQADNVLLKDGKIQKIKKNITQKNEDETIGEFLGPVVFSSRGSKLFVERYEHLEKYHKGDFHDATSLKKAYLTDMIQELIDSGVQVLPIMIEGKWCEIDTPEDLEIAKQLFP